MSKFVGFLLVSLIVPLNHALAAPFNIDATKPDVANTGPYSSVDNIILNVIDFIILIAGIGFLVLFFVGAIRYLTGAGDPKATESAKKLLVDAIIGLILVLASWAIATFIYKALTSSTKKYNITDFSTTGATIAPAESPHATQSLEPIVTVEPPTTTGFTVSPLTPTAGVNGTLTPSTTASPTNGLPSPSASTTQTGSPAPGGFPTIPPNGG